MNKLPVGSLFVCLIFFLSGFSALAQSTKVIKESLKSVVMIIAFDKEGKPTGLGSGFIINDKGDIVTNYHVVEGASGVVVRLVGSEKRFPADLIVYKNAEHDLAVIRAKGLKAPALKLGDDLVQEIGGKIIAIGNPKGFSGTVSEGIISGFRKLDDKLRLMQITAPISPGSSGGPVMTEKGEVVGIATAVIRSAQNLNFAIPVSNLKELIKGKPLDLDFASKNLPSENVGLTNLKSKKAAPFKKVLTDAKKGYRDDSWQMVANDLPDYKGDAKWHIRKRILQGGKQEGVEIIEVDNGELRFRVIPTRGMGILDVNLGNVRLGWDSPIKEVVHPKFVNLESRGGLGWIEGFNEWMARCGLEYAGHPGKDTFTTNTGDTGEMDLTLHGKISNIPASEVIVTVDRVAPYTIRVRGRVDDRVFFGPKLELWTEISTVPGSNKFTISDTLTNRGSESQEFMLIYHANYGSPLLEKGAKLVTAAKRVAPFNDHAAKAVNRWDTYAVPKSGFVEEVFQIFPFADKDDRTTIQLQNANGDRAVSMNWSLKELPYLTQWKNTVAKQDGYVTGLEPGTSFPHNRKWERAKGRVSKLQPGQTRSFAITFGIQTGKAEVAAVAKEINALRGNRKTTVDKNPESDPFPKSE